MNQPNAPSSPRPDRRWILRGAFLAAVPYALLPAARAGAEPRAVDYPFADWQPANPSNRTAADRPARDRKSVV